MKRFIIVLMLGTIASGASSLASGAATAGKGADDFIRSVGQQAIASLTGKELSDEQRQTRFREILTRTFEVPACSGFLLTDRTPGQAQYFEEDREIACFDSPEELHEKVRYYLEHDDEREAIREAGHQRCMSSGYDYEARMREVLSEIEKARAEVLGQP